MLKSMLRAMLVEAQAGRLLTTSRFDEIQQSQNEQSISISQIAASLTARGCLSSFRKWFSGQQPDIHVPRGTVSNANAHTPLLTTAERVLSMSVEEEAFLQASRSDLKRFLASRGAQTDQLKELANGQGCALLLTYKGMLEARKETVKATAAAVIIHGLLKKLISSGVLEPDFCEEMQEASAQLPDAAAQDPTQLAQFHNEDRLLQDTGEATLDLHRAEVGSDDGEAGGAPVPLPAPQMPLAEDEPEPPHQQWTPERKARNKLEILAKREENTQRANGGEVAQGVVPGLEGGLEGADVDQLEPQQGDGEGLIVAEIGRPSRQEVLDLEVRVWLGIGINSKGTSDNGFGCL